MTTRADICAEALRWVGTPYHHEACLCQVGVDCAMLLVGIGIACGVVGAGWRPPHYSPEWHLHRTEPLLEQTIEALGGVLIPQEQAHSGHIVLMTFGRVASHAGILMDDARLIHATLQDMRVVHHGFTGDWCARWACTYAYPGVR